MAQLDESINMRVNGDQLKLFKEKCDAMGGSSGYQNLLREFMRAYNEGRLKILATPQHKELYHDD